MKILFSCILFLLKTAIGSSQDNNLEKTSAWFDNTIGDNVSGLYNGSLYVIDIPVSTKNHPYFKSLGFVSGNLDYDNQLYFDVSLQYDLIEDNLIISSKNITGSLSLRLVKEKVRYFTHGNTEFVNISPNHIKTDKNIGFCEVLLRDGDFALYQKHHIQEKETSKERKVFILYEPYSYYYLQMGEHIHLIDNKRDFIRLFPEQKKYITDYFKSYRDLQKTNYTEFIKPLYTYLISKTVHSP